MQPYHQVSIADLDELSGGCMSYASNQTANKPGSGAWMVFTEKPSVYGVQVAFPVSNTQEAYYLRYSNANGWGEWRQA